MYVKTNYGNECAVQSCLLKFHRSLLNLIKNNICLSSNLLIFYMQNAKLFDENIVYTNSKRPFSIGVYKEMV